MLLGQSYRYTDHLYTSGSGVEVRSVQISVLRPPKTASIRASRCDPYPALAHPSPTIFGLSSKPPSQPQPTMATHHPSHPSQPTNTPSHPSNEAPSYFDQQRSLLVSEIAIVRPVSLSLPFPSPPAPTASRPVPSSLHSITPSTTRQTDRQTDRPTHDRHRLPSPCLRSTAFVTDDQ